MCWIHFFLSLFSTGFVVFPRSSLSPSRLSEGKNGFLFFCSFLHTLPCILSAWMERYYLLLQSSPAAAVTLSSLLSVKFARWCPSPRHHPTVNEWVCHSANNLHSSCLICLGLRGSESWYPGGERVCLGSRTVALRNSTVCSRLVWKACVGSGCYPWSWITSLLSIFVALWGPLYWLWVWLGKSLVSERSKQKDKQNNRAESHGRLKIVSVISICKNPKPM